MSSTNDDDDDGFQTMSRRKPKKGNNTDGNKKKFTKQQRRSTNNYTGKQQSNKGRKNKKGFSGGPSLSSRGWSKPTTEEDWGETTTTITTIESEPALPTSTTPKLDDPIDRASEAMASVVQSEISKASTVDEKINAAIASTAAATTMASLMNSMGFTAHRQAQPQVSNDSKPDEKILAAPNFASFAKGQKMEDLLGDLGERDPNWKEKQFPKFSDEDDNNNTNTQNQPSEPKSFSAFCKGQSTSALLADFGQADPHWKQKVIVEEEPKPRKASQKQQQQQPKPQAPSLSKLAPHGKAAIHMSIESFGVAHGAPSRGARDRSGSPHTQPLEWLDVGDAITDPVPEHLEFHDGLRSGVIKRLLKTAPIVIGEETTNLGWDDDDDDESSVDLQSVKDFAGYCREHLAGTKIFPSLLEAIHEGGHGYVNPLTMRFSIGSHLGRHRSVVATEWVAQHLRYLLRNHNEAILPSSSSGGNYNPKDLRPITCSVSVGTVHRDVNKRIPQKHYKEDDEDYVDKNDRV